MKKFKILLPVLALVLSIAAINELYAAELTGEVVNLQKIIKGQDGAISKAEAIDHFKSGGLFAYKTSDGKIYMVFNTDGSVADRQLAKNADNKSLKITGKVHKDKGFQYIIADKFE